MSAAADTGAATRRPARRSVLVLLGVVMGVYSTLCGIGGGVFAVPLLHYVYRMPLRSAVANSLVLVAASTTSATLLEAFRPDSALLPGLVGALVAGSIVGSRVGFAIGKRASTGALKTFFALLLAGVAVHLLAGHGVGDAFAPADARTEPTTGAYALVALVGLAAGIVAPLLGIGGGLVAVPALLFLLPGLGFLAARACSMAMSTVNSWQSVWLYRRDGEIRSSSGLWLAVGAVAGAAVGIQLVHVPVVMQSARVLVALALLFAAGRFGWDVWPRARTA